MNSASQPEVTSEIPDPLAEGPEAVIQPMESVQLLKSSIRCLYLGMAGLVPFLGAGLAYGALRLGTELLERTCEEWDWEPFVVLWIVGAIEILLIDWGLNLGGSFPATLVMLGAQACLVTRRYLIGRPLRFNAARLHVFAGMGLAMTGLATTLFIAGIVLGKLILPELP